MNWNKPILTDSGGFQIMSLSKLNKLIKILALYLDLILMVKKLF